MKNLLKGISFLLIASPKFKALARIFKREEEFKILDVGCGNHSPVMTKKYFPKCYYYGIDKDIYNYDEEDKIAMDEFYRLDLEKTDLSVLEEDFFDAIILNHVIEHLHNGLELIKNLTKKLKSKGIIYIEFPSERSLFLPTMKGTLNFFDDPTHVKIYTIAEINVILFADNFNILKLGVRRDIPKALLTPFTFL
ncbi:MAG: class I SAM-dependent methyltransferase, partial [Candidatus Omnitrophica bacterium]|nr:class I SAM-dependent methyltransferase [Candidatus Omnitrophota bacterium]